MKKIIIAKNVKKDQKKHKRQKDKQQYSKHMIVCAL